MEGRDGDDQARPQRDPTVKGSPIMLRSQLCRSGLLCSAEISFLWREYEIVNGSVNEIVMSVSLLTIDTLGGG